MGYNHGSLALQRCSQNHSPLGNNKTGVQDSKAHMVFVQDARTLTYCQAKKGNIQKKTLSGKTSVSSILTLRQLPGSTGDRELGKRVGGRLRGGRNIQLHGT